MVGNLLDLTPNKVSVDLTQYSTVWMGDTGVGKTTTLMKFLKELVPDKDPFFLEFEDRYQNIPGIMAQKVDTMSDFKSIIGQLRNPALKQKFSCIIIDTLDKYEEFCERYVLENRDAEILKDVHLKLCKTPISVYKGKREQETLNHYIKLYNDYKREKLNYKTVKRYKSLFTYLDSCNINTVTVMDIGRYNNIIQNLEKEIKNDYLVLNGKEYEGYIYTMPKRKTKKK